MRPRLNHPQRVTPRRIGRAEMMLYRAYLQGLSPAKIAHRLAGEDPRSETPGETIRWIRGELMMAARRARKFRYLRLVSLKPQALAPGANAVPDLERFQREVDPNGVFYREADLLKLYLERYPQGAGAARRERRRARLEAEQREALAYLEQALVVEPQRADPIAAWFPDHTAQRLLRGDIDTVGALIERVEILGQRWYRGVRGLGEKGAAWITFWLQQHEKALEVKLSARALTRRRALDVTAYAATLPAGSAIVPLERLRIDRATLDGSQGENRVREGFRLLAADNDYAAVQTWLSLRQASPHTQRAYRKEAERLLLWAVLDRAKPLSSLRTEDCAGYMTFLAQLGRAGEGEWGFKLPQDAWLGARNAERISPAWRPFDGPLSASSQLHARRILQSLFQWLVSQRYLQANPWWGLPRITLPLLEGTDSGTLAARRRQIAKRTISEAQWAMVLEQAQDLADTPAGARLWFVLRFAQASGLRASELAQAKIEHLHHALHPKTKQRYVMLTVQGKGNKVREVPVTSPLMRALSVYLVSRGLHNDPFACGGETHLIGSLEARAEVSSGITAGRIYEILRDFFGAVANSLEARGLREDARLLAHATTHWLRHTCGAHAIARGVRTETVAQNFGHASVATTALYTHLDDALRHDEMEQRAGEP